MSKYRVKHDGTVVYADKRRWKMLYILSKGALWEGDPVEGQNWHHNRIWIKGFDGFVWSGDLEQMNDADGGSGVV
jgi:hypothetical protein